MDTTQISHFLDKMDELPAPVQIRLSRSERIARQELRKLLPAGTSSEILRAVGGYLHMLKSLPAPVLIQLPGTTHLEELLAL